MTDKVFTLSLQYVFCSTVLTFSWQDLRRCYEEICYFFHNPHGGDVVGVLWRPEVLLQKPLEESSSGVSSGIPPPAMRFEERTVGTLTGDVIEDLGKRKTHVEFNVQAFVEDVKILGDGIVEQVHVRTENWS